MADDGETVTEMRLDIGGMRSDMRHLADTMTAYIERAEDCQKDHEIRLRAVETAAAAVAQIADIKTQLSAAEKRLGTMEKTLTTAQAGWTTVAQIGGLAGGVLGLICGIIGAVVAVFTMFGGI